MCQNPGWQPTGLLVALLQFLSFNGILNRFDFIIFADNGVGRETCNRARRKELAQMRIIQERYPHRHVSKLQKNNQNSEAGQGEQRPSWGAKCYAWSQSPHLNNSSQTTALSSAISICAVEDMRPVRSAQVTVMKIVDT